jgi:hypothetical protein
MLIAVMQKIRNTSEDKARLHELNQQSDAQKTAVQKEETTV